jgi:hypothetical protein
MLTATQSEGRRVSLLENSVPRGLYLSLIRPDGREAACQTLTLSVDETRLNNYMWVRVIGAEFDVIGPWKLRVHSGGFLRAEYAVGISAVQ